MTKRDLVKQIQKDFGFSRRLSEKIIDRVLQGIRNGLKQGKPVLLRNFGTFTPLEPYVKKFRHIKTGKIIQKIIKDKVKFKQSKNILNV